MDKIACLIEYFDKSDMVSNRSSSAKHKDAARRKASWFSGTNVCIVAILLLLLAAFLFFVMLSHSMLGEHQAKDVLRTNPFINNVLAIEVSD